PTDTIHNGYRPGLAVRGLPRVGGERRERRFHPGVKLATRAFHAVGFAARGCAGQPDWGRYRYEDREVRYQARRRGAVRRNDLGLGKSTASHLVRIRRKEEAIQEHDGT